MTTTRGTRSSLGQRTLHIPVCFVESVVDGKSTKNIRKCNRSCASNNERTELHSFREQADERKLLCFAIYFYLSPIFQKGHKVLNSQNPSRLGLKQIELSVLSYPCYSLPATSVHTLGGRKQDLAMLFGGEHGHKTDIQLGVSHPPHLTSKTVTATAQGGALPPSNVLDISQKEEREALSRGGVALSPFPHARLPGYNG